MRIHHLDCGTLSCIGGAWVGGHGHPLRRHRMVCHVLLVETREGLVLVDTGLGTADLAAPERLGFAFHRGFSPSKDLEGTALHQLRARGFSPEDVRHIVVTHLDLDHAGGFPDFPEARVHVLATEQAAAMSRRTMKERTRYLPAQFAHPVKWETYAPAAEGDRWFGFECVRELRGLPPEILLVPLIGHTAGHAGIAISRPDGWLLHCGDAYFHRASVTAGGSAPAALAFFDRAIAMDREAMLGNQARLTELKADASAKVELFSAHDPVEFDALVKAAAAKPVRVKRSAS